MKRKKELIITIAGAAVLFGTLCLMTGCSGSSGNNVSIGEIATSFYVMEDKSGCLSCFGCVNRSSKGGCSGGPTYSYVGCVDCFGITSSDDTTAADIDDAMYMCNGYYCVNYGITDDNGNVTPVYGCYKRS